MPEYPAGQATLEPADSDLAAIAALSTTVFGRNLLTLADAAAGRTALGLGTAAVAASTAFDAAGAAAAAQAASQPADADLAAIAALNTTVFGRSFLDRADAAAGRALLGLGTAATTDQTSYAPLSAPFVNFAAALKSGVESVGFGVISDSTASGTNRWPYLVGQSLAALLPTWTVKNIVWDDTNTKYFNAANIQLGAAGERYGQVGVSGSFNVPYTDVAAITGDIDIRGFIAPNSWATGSLQTVAALWGGSGHRCIRFTVGTDGKLYLNWTANGTVFIDVFSSGTVMALAGAVNGAGLWVRATLDVDNGGGGYTVTFYTSTNGYTWTQLGTATTTSAGVTSIYTDTAAGWWVGGRIGATDLLNGKIYEVQIRSGIDGAPVAPFAIDRWRPEVSGDSTFGGAPTIYIVNATNPGRDMTYLTDATRLPKMTPNYGQALTFVACSHNDTNAMGATYMGLWDTMLSTIKSRLPASEMVLITENPRTSPAANIREHTMRRRDQMGWARRNSVPVIDVYGAFVADGRGLAVLDNADGIHPSDAAGSPLWASNVYSLLAAAYAATAG